MQKSKTVEFKAIILGIDSNYESVTEAACRYRNEHVYPHMASKGFEVNLLQGKLARRPFFRKAAIDYGVEYITGVGHGYYDEFTGHWHATILKVDEYHPKEVSGKIIHLLSCRTGGELGPDLINNGAKAYFGYSENFKFTLKYADIFFECDAAIDKGLADGLTAEEVHEKVTALFQERIDDLAEVNGVAAATLLYNLEMLCTPVIDAMFGDRNARLTE